VELVFEWLFQAKEDISGGIFGELRGEEKRIGKLCHDLIELCPQSEIAREENFFPVLSSLPNIPFFSVKYRLRLFSSEDKEIYHVDRQSK